MSESTVTTPSVPWTVRSRTELQKIAGHIATHTPNSLLLALEDVASEEEALPVQPLVHLSAINAIACSQCKRTLAASQQALTNHLKTHRAPGDSLSRDAAREQAAAIRSILEQCGGITTEAARAIPNGHYYFPSLAVSTNSLFCAEPGCSWVHADIESLHRAGARHINRAHGVYLSPGAEWEYHSHASHFVSGLPVQSVRGIESGQSTTYFLAALPDPFLSPVPADSNDTDK